MGKKYFRLIARGAQSLYGYYSVFNENRGLSPNSVTVESLGFRITSARVA